MTTIHSEAAVRREQLVRAEQVRALYSQLPRSTVAMAVGGLIVLFAMWGAVEPALLGGWFACVLLNQGWRLDLYRRFRDNAPGVDAMERWARYWAIGAGLSGVIWGASAPLMFVPGSVGHQAFLAVALFSVTTGALTLIAIDAISFHAFVIAALSPLVVRFGIEGTPIHLAIGAACLGVMFVLLGFGRNLNRLLTQSLRTRFENIELIAELREQKRVAEKAQFDAEVATRAKSRFLAAASHDLRQPLHAMGLFAAALSERVRDPGVQDVVDSINASVEALEALFNELLDISKLDAGVIEPNRSHFALGPLLARLCSEFKPEAAGKGLRLRTVATTAVVYSDPVLVERVVRNFLANAIRYTRRGGVVVGCRRTADGFRVEVWDTGIGIPESERGHIFEEFYQLANPERNTKKGMGLGLAIIRRIADLLGYRLLVTSVVGRGSRFAMDIPRGRITSTLGPATAPGDSVAHDLRGRVVAVIDDEEAILEGMRVLLDGWGCTVVAAPSLAACIAGLQDLGRAPDLVVADYRLQDGADGIAAIEGLRARYGKALAAILVTGSTTQEPTTVAARHDADLLHKPVMPGKLRVLVAAKLAQVPRPPSA